MWASIAENRVFRTKLFTSTETACAENALFMWRNREQSLKFQENRRGTLAFSREYDILMMVKDSQNSRRNDMRLSDSIETFIKTLLAEDEPEVELKRNELAEYFG